MTECIHSIYDIHCISSIVLNCHLRLLSSCVTSAKITVALVISTLVVFIKENEMLCSHTVVLYRLAQYTR